MLLFTKKKNLTRIPRYPSKELVTVDFDALLSKICAEPTFLNTVMAVDCLGQMHVTSEILFYIFMCKWYSERLSHLYRQKMVAFIFKF